MVVFINATPDPLNKDVIKTCLDKYSYPNLSMGPANIQNIEITWIKSLFSESIGKKFELNELHTFQGLLLFFKDLFDFGKNTKRRKSGFIKKLMDDEFDVTIKFPNRFEWDYFALLVITKLRFCWGYKPEKYLIYHTCPGLQLLVKLLMRLNA